MNVNLTLTARRKKVLLVGLAVLAITACQDAVAPHQRLTAGRASLTSAPNATASFVYDPTYGVTATVGSFKIKMPNGTVCDPATSSYGPGTWDSPCVAASAPITVTANSYTNLQGKPFIQFSPALRFQPNSSGKVVMLYLYDKSIAVDTTSRILYCNDLGVCVDESLTDPSVAVMFDAPNGFVYRQLKHFSGYNITAGYTDSTTTGDPTLTDPTLTTTLIY